jgi:hypothetical protein
VTGRGWEGRRASEDEFDVGAILYRMRQRGVGLDERARRVVDLYLAPPEKILRAEQRRPASRASRA